MAGGPHRSLEPTWHQPASLAWRKETREPPGPGTPSFLRADVTPRWRNVLPSASPPGFQFLPGSSPDLKPPYSGGMEAGESCGQSQALAEDAKAGVGFDVIMVVLGEG